MYVYILAVYCGMSLHVAQINVDTEVRVGFVVNWVALGQVSLPTAYLSRCHYRSSSAARLSSSSQLPLPAVGPTGGRSLATFQWKWHSFGNPGTSRKKNTFNFEHEVGGYGVGRGMPVLTLNFPPPTARQTCHLNPTGTSLRILFVWCGKWKKEKKKLVRSRLDYQNKCHCPPDEWNCACVTHSV